MNQTRSTIVYITREIERALGITPNPKYLIVTNRNAYSEKIKQLYPDFVTLIDAPAEDMLGTGDLMKHPATESLIANLTEKHGIKPYILVFKNTARIEPIAKEHGWTLLNPSEAISEKIENKVSAIAWLGELAKYLPPHRVEYTKNIKWDGKPFIVQWAHGHTGGGTILIESEEALKALQARFPERRCKVTSYIEGPSFTVNVVVTPHVVYPSSVSYQITGIGPFTDSRFATIGNDWKLPTTLLTAADKEWLKKLIDEIGIKMQKEHWRGLFGIDMIRGADGKMYFIEINARQPASSTYESSLQEMLRRLDVSLAGSMTTFEAHLKALLGEEVSSLIEIKDGAQIVQRVTKDTKSVDAEVVGSLELAGYTVISYENTDENADLIRVQSKSGIMEGHNILSEAGKEISDNIHL